MIIRLITDRAVSLEPMIIRRYVWSWPNEAEQSGHLFIKTMLPKISKSFFNSSILTYVSTCLISSRSSSLPPSCRWFLINLTLSLLSIALNNHCMKPSTDKAATKTIQNHRKAYTFSVYMLMGSTHCTVYRCMFPNRRTLQKKNTLPMRNTRIFKFKLGRGHHESLMYNCLLIWNIYKWHSWASTAK